MQPTPQAPVLAAPRETVLWLRLGTLFVALHDPAVREPRAELLTELQLDRKYVMDSCAGLVMRVEA